MKPLIYIVIGAIFFILIKTSPMPPHPSGAATPIAVSLSNPSQGKDPVESMAAIVAAMPAQLSNGARLSHFSYNVTKTDSLVSPLIGDILFTEEQSFDSHCQFVFQWRKDHWEYARFFDTDTGKDYTDLPWGTGLATTPPLQQVLEAYMEDGGVAMRARARANHKAIEELTASLATPTPAKVSKWSTWGNGGLDRPR